MRKRIYIAFIILSILFVIGCNTSAPKAKGISLNKLSLILEEGNSEMLIAALTPKNTTSKVTWKSKDEAVATVSNRGVVTGVSEDDTIITAKVEDYSATCRVFVDKTPTPLNDDGLEMEESGYIYYEDFSKRNEVPTYLMKTEKGFSTARIEDDMLCLRVVDGGDNDHVFLIHEFEEKLNGKITVEAKIKAGSLSFINVLFFFIDTDDFYSGSNIIANLTMEGGYFKNNSGSGWTATSLKYEVGISYEIRMVLDIDAGVYHLTVGDKTQKSIAFRKKVTSDSTIKNLRLGSNTAWADAAYEYIRIREAEESDFENTLAFDYTCSFDGIVKSADISTANTSGGSVDFAADGYVTMSTPTSGTVSVTKAFDTVMEGIVATEVKFKNNSSVNNTFANVMFLKSGGTYVVTIAVANGCLRINENNGGWKLIPFNSNYIKLVDGKYYTLTAVNNFVTNKTNLYLTGEKYIKVDSGETTVESDVTLGDNVYIGEFDFRNSGNPDTVELAIGTGKPFTSYTVDYIKICSVDMF